MTNLGQLTPHEVESCLVHQNAQKGGSPCRDEIDQAVQDVGLRRAYTILVHQEHTKKNIGGY